MAIGCDPARGTTFIDNLYFGLGGVFRGGKTRVACKINLLNTMLVDICRRTSILLPMEQDTAHQITQDFLDRQGEATIAGDIEETLKWCDIPCTLESLQGRVVASTVDEMRAICTAFINELQEKRLTHLVRNCQEAVRKDDDTIWATYETRYVQSGSLLSEDTYVGFVILKRKKDRWKINTMQFAVSSDSPANVTLREWATKHSVA